MQNPIITIITVSFNDLENLKTTAQTIFKQSYKNIEYIIVDGGSSDGTIDFIRNNEGNISCWLSEKDNGIYDAMNKGIHLAKGDFICFMNCGDFFVSDNIIEIIAKKISDEKIENDAIVYTDFSRKGISYIQPQKLDLYLYVRPLCHQSMFFGKKVFEKIGCYDLSYKILADYEHTLRSYKKGITFIHCKCVSCDYLSGGFSETSKNKCYGKVEARKIIKMYFTLKERCIYFIRYHLTLPVVRKILFSDKSPLWLRAIYRKFVNFFIK